MLVLLQGCDPGHVVEGYNFKPEVLVVADLLNFVEKGREVGRGDIVDVGQEVCWCELWVG